MLQICRPTRATTLFICAIFFLTTATTWAFKPKANMSNMPKTGPRNDESAVLRELKETIGRQSKELELLRSQVNRSSAAKPNGHSGGAHGGGPEMQADEYLKLPFYRIASHRVGWLSLFLCSLSLTALIMNGFENTLHRQLELAYFVPYVLTRNS